MSAPLPFFNWSLTKALQTEESTFGKARVRIVFTILLFSLLKAALVVCFAALHGQWLQFTRAGVAFILYLTIAKLLLYRPHWLQRITHVLLIAGLLIIWSNVFVFAHKVNVMSVQFVFMIAVCSFYTMGAVMGVVYTTLGMLPIIIALAFHGSANAYFTQTAQEFASPGYEIIVALNFISISVTHYLFYNAFRHTIEEKENLNQQLLASIAEANKLAKTKTDFLSTMSHELRTPLNSVIGITEMLMEEKTDEKNKENLKLLQFSAQDLLSLINNILDINKLDLQKMTLEKTPFQLSALMQNVCATLKLKANEKNIAFLLNIDKQLQNATVLSDPTRLSQVIYNLGSNALKFTEKGSVAITLTCVAKEQDNISVQFSITDTGIGIPPDKHETIFDQFTQASTDTTRKYGGSGLGLAIVKQVLDLFDTGITLESNPGKGSKFYFTINFELAPIVTRSNTDAVNRHDLNMLKVLVADDNDVNRIVIRKQLAKLGIEATITEGGEQVIAACKAGYFDAVFIDLNMPFVSGYDALKTIRALPDAAIATTNIIAFTASITEQAKITAAGFDDYIYKPVKLSDLQDKLAKIAQQKQKQ